MGFRTDREKEVQKALQGSRNLFDMEILTTPDPKGQKEELEKSAQISLNGHIYVSCMTRDFKLKPGTRVFSAKPGILIMIMRNNQDMKVGYEDVDNVTDSILQIMYGLDYDPVNDYIDPTPQTSGLRVGLMYFIYNRSYTLPDWDDPGVN